MFAIMRRYTPSVEEYSIDEGFADISGLRRPFHASYQTLFNGSKPIFGRNSTLLSRRG